MTNYLNAKNGIEILHKDGLTQLLAGSGDPSVVGQVASIGSIFLRSDNGGGIYNKIGLNDNDWVLSTVSGTNDTFTELLDTPNNYINNSGNFLKVTTNSSGIEFTDVIDCGTFL